MAGELAEGVCRRGNLDLGRVARRQGALERGEPWGVWGGEILHQGAVIPRKVKRGRPRKDVAA